MQNLVYNLWNRKLGNISFENFKISKVANYENLLIIENSKSSYL